ncbi:hypothetical protein [Actinacidiphila glaucinigra]|uniref:hypothetical protein n=1 Tax=Actinacidiphila glaucinigra TaxID=235986 RepID=UPI002E2FFB58|nr:hypothetical protein [Actinacidiphila glaucinigra]
MKKSEVFASVAREMKSLGFKRRRSNYEYVLDLGDGFEGWCSFAEATKGEQSTLWVATFAGVRCAEVEDRILEWCGDVVPGWDGRSYVATVSMNVGYLTPQAKWLEHRISLTEESVADVIAPNISDVTDIGLPFMQEHASCASLVTALELDKGQLSDRSLERLPLALVLQGDVESAYRELARMKLKVDEASFLAPRYLRFIAGFEKEFPQE